MSQTLGWGGGKCRHFYLWREVNTLFTIEKGDLKKCHIFYKGQFFLVFQKRNLVLKIIILFFKDHSKYIKIKCLYIYI